MNQVFKNDSSLYFQETLCHNHEHTDNSYKFHKTHSHIYISKKLYRETKKSDRLPEIRPKKIKKLNLKILIPI